MGHPGFVLEPIVVGADAFAAVLSEWVSERYAYIDLLLAVADAEARRNLEDWMSTAGGSRLGQYHGYPIRRADPFFDEVVRAWRRRGE